MRRADEACYAAKAGRNQVQSAAAPDAYIDDVEIIDDIEDDDYALADDPLGAVAGAILAIGRLDDHSWMVLWPIAVIPFYLLALTTCQRYLRILQHVWQPRFGQLVYGTTSFHAASHWCGDRLLFTTPVFQVSSSLLDCLDESDLLDRFKRAVLTYWAVSPSIYRFGNSTAPHRRHQI